MLEIKKRNLLCLKKEFDYDDEEQLTNFLLTPAYKNILKNLLDLALTIDSKKLDPITETFNGIYSAPNELKHYYQALIEVTSYFQASKGGRGSFIVKRIASLGEFTSIDLKLCELPLWLKEPNLYKKKGIFTNNSLNFEEKEKFISEYRWIGEERYNIKSDLGNLINNKKDLFLIQIKSRVDGGGVAGIREFWDSKYPLIIELISNNSLKIFQKGKKKYSLVEFLLEQKIQNFHFYNGMLFDMKGKPVKINEESNNFFKKNIELYQESLIKLRNNSEFCEINELSSKKLICSFKQKMNPKTKISVGLLLGEEIPQIFLQKSIPIEKFIEIKVDDMWLSLTYTITERALLLKNKTNYLIELKKIIDEDIHAKDIFNNIIDSEGHLEEIRKFQEYILKNYNSKFNPNYLNDISIFCKNTFNIYLGDIIQIFACCFNL